MLSNLELIFVVAPMLNNDESGRHKPDLEAEFAEFAGFQAGFRRNGRGNLSRRFEGRRLAVYRRGLDNAFGWSITGSGGSPDYSPEGYGNEEDAMFGLGRALGFPV